MDQTAPSTERNRQPDPAPDQAGSAVPSYIGFLLGVVRSLLSYGRHLDATFPAGASHPRFVIFAAGFGTHDVRRILLHVQRGILKAMMLEKYLLARAAQGRDIEPKAPPAEAEPADIEALEMKLRAPAQCPRRAASPRVHRTDPDDPMHFELPSLKELEAQVRRHPIGQTIAEICLDLGIVPSACSGESWDEIYDALRYFGTNLKRFHSVQSRRRDAFQTERDRLPETWTIDWRDRSRDVFRQILGRLYGEPPPEAVPLAARHARA